MAIDPSALYPGQIDTSDPTGYPYGAAQNVTVAGDGTGTPLEKDLVNDIFGFQQALLEEANITPSGTPDKVGASQYLEAIQEVIANTVGDAFEHRVAQHAVLNVNPQYDLENDISEAEMCVVWCPFASAPQWRAFMQAGNSPAQEYYRSHDGLLWEPVSVTAAPHQSAAYNNERVAIASDTAVFYQTITGPLTAATIASTGWVYVTSSFGGATDFVAAKAGSFAFSTDDGETYTTAAGPTNWAAGGFIPAQIARSSLGGNSRLLAVPRNAGGDYFAYSTTAGSVWNEVEAPEAPANGWRGVCWNSDDEAFYAIAGSSPYQTYRSDDNGDSWIPVGPTFSGVPAIGSLHFHVNSYMAFITTDGQIVYGRGGGQWLAGAASKRTGHVIRAFAVGDGQFAGLLQASSFGSVYAFSTARMRKSFLGWP